MESRYYSAFVFHIAVTELMNWPIKLSVAGETVTSMIKFSLFFMHPANSWNDYMATHHCCGSRFISHQAHIQRNYVKNKLLVSTYWPKGPNKIPRRN